MRGDDKVRFESSLTHQTIQTRGYTEQWREGTAHLIWDQEAAGSSPVCSTSGGASPRLQSKICRTHNRATAIAEYAGLDRDTMRRRFREPKSFKLGEILTLTTKLRMGPESLECLTRGGKVS